MTARKRRVPGTSKQRVFAGRLRFFGVVCLATLAACQGEGDKQGTQKNVVSDVNVARPKPETGNPYVNPNVNPYVRRDGHTLSVKKGIIAPGPYPRPYPGPVYERDRETYEKLTPNPIKQVLKQPVSTFSIDVDTGAYANIRRMLRAGQMPPRDAVRIEEMINYFPYQYAPPANRQVPFAVSSAVARTPWNANTYLVRVAIKGYQIARSERPAANLVFLVDVSGSMTSRDKLPLLVSSLKLLTARLTARDRVTLVVYAGAAGVVLKPTPGNEKAMINSALDRLKAGGSTAGGAGIKLAYAMARQAFIRGGINRVILATDGDFNVGVTDRRKLLDMIKRNRKSGVALTTLGFGTGNYNEAIMERAADAGNGNYAYIDSLQEAQKVLVAELNSTLLTIAKDVKIQVEFNPAVVAEYRLIGYENRALKREDFNNDKVDAGDIGAGHTVTALYEVALVGSKGLRLPPLKFQKAPVLTGDKSLFAHMKLRYKLPGSKTSRLIDVPLSRSQMDRATAPTGDFAFAAAVAAFGEILRGGKYVGDFSYADVRALAQRGKGADPEGYRGGFLRLVRLAAALTPQTSQTPKPPVRE